MEITVEGEGTLTFWWKVSSDYGDELQFIADGVLKDDIDEEVDWNQKQYNVAGTGAHSFLWQYVKDGSEEDGDDRGFVDYVQWTGSPPSGGSAGWEEITYTYDPSGRRIEKDIDGDTTTYVYDGANVIAEYNDAGSLSKKFIHGGGIDELVCMIDVENSSAVYYYHYDGLGSVVALTNSSGNSCQSYQYSVYGQVAASDPNFTANPYMFTGRRFDYETGLYYYRARYYNPYIGRFLQTDPIGYGDGINWYAYCHNNPVNFADPYGKATWSYSFEWKEKGYDLTIFKDGESVGTVHGDSDLMFVRTMVSLRSEFTSEWYEAQPEYGLYKNSEEGITLFWQLKFLNHMGVFSGKELEELGDKGVKISKKTYTDPSGVKHRNYYLPDNKTVYWGGMFDLNYGENWDIAPAFATLAHELDHAHYDLCLEKTLNIARWEVHAVQRENEARRVIFDRWLGGEKFSGSIYPRMSYRDPDPDSTQPQQPGLSSVDAWKQYLPSSVVY